MEESLESISIQNNEGTTEALISECVTSEKLSECKGQRDTGYSDISTDIHEEINRKLEELEKFGSESIVDKTNTGDLQVDVFGVEMKDNVGESTENTSKVDDFNSAGTDIEESIELQQEKNNTSDKTEMEESGSDFPELQLSADQPSEVDQNISTSVTEQTNNETQHLECESEKDREVSVNKEDVVTTEASNEQPIVDFDIQKNILTNPESVPENPITVESSNIVEEITSEIVEEVVDEEGLGESVPCELKSETVNEIEITEIDSTEIVAIEEIPAEYTVIEATEEVQVKVNNDNKISEAIEEQVVGNDASTEEVYVVGINMEEKDNQQASDHELFVVTNEPDSDPLITPKEEKPKPKPRGRKSTNQIPSHVMGVDLKNPAADTTVNGSSRTPKPRLGVKVPYRNLASQIVTKQEIQEEIMERFRQKQAQQEAEEKDAQFARKLTQRLASKIVPEAIYPTKQDVAAVTASRTPLPKLNTSSRIEKDADLLAILEGDDDDDDLQPLSEEEKKKEAEKKTKEREREIALKQLQELPPTSPVPQKPSKHRIEETPKDKSSFIQKTSMPVKYKTKSDSHSNRKSEKTEIDIEPKLKPGMVIKTYTRKRKSTDVDSPIHKKTIAVNDSIEEVKIEEDKKVTLPTSTALIDLKPIIPPNAYVTKSSRVIKKKVIWDPDEVPSPRSFMKSPKTPDVTRSTEKKTSNEKITEKKTSEKFADKKTSLEKKSSGEKSEKKVVPEKKIIHKVSMSPKKGKRLTEVDRLLMDEGAINMLYEVKNTDEPQSKLKKKQKTHISIDKAEKELRNRASELLKDLQQNSVEETQKSLRKKESPPVGKKEIVTGPATIERKKSKDSVRSSVHSPPASPGQPYEASRIIRRHSSSSFSSGDEPQTDKESEKSSKRKITSQSDVPKKKSKKSTDEVSKSKLEKDSPQVSSKSEAVSEAKSKDVPATPKVAKAFTIKRSEKLCMFDLHYKDSAPYFTSQILKDLTSSLNRLAKDSNCHVIVFTSSRRSFCLGLNYKDLIADTEALRQKKATEMSNCVRDFLKSLLHFPKPLVAGIQGDCSGLGVTMLSLFDLVIASDKAHFSMPYGSLGVSPEAAFLLTVPHVSSHGLASELFYSCTKLNAGEVSRHGLVSRLCWPEKYKDELKTTCIKISQQSRQSMEATKKQLRANLIEPVEKALSLQNAVLVEHWVSAECQQKFAEYVLESD